MKYTNQFYKTFNTLLAAATCATSFTGMTAYAEDETNHKTIDRFKPIETVTYTIENTKSDSLKYEDAFEATVSIYPGGNLSFNKGT